MWLKAKGVTHAKFPESQQLVDLSETFKPNGFGSVSVPNLEDWKNQNTVFVGISPYFFTSFNLEGGDTPQRIPGINVGANYFDVLGVKPTLGRAFLPGEDIAGRERGYNGNISVEGKTYPPNESPLVEYRVVNDDYFQTTGIPLRQGRVFNKQEGDDCARQESQPRC